MKRIKVFFVVFILIILVCFYKTRTIEKEQEEQNVSVSQLSGIQLHPVGMPIGIYMDTDGVMVVGTSPIKGADHMEHEPAKTIVREGDYIEAMNRHTIQSKQDLMNEVKDLNDQTKEVSLTIRRNDMRIEVKFEPVYIGTQTYKLGIWVRDNVQGLGTITFVNDDLQYGALGHGIHDPDTDLLLDMSKGKLYKTSILSVKKGEAGNPGGLEGVIVYNKYHEIGNIKKNNECGIYGELRRNLEEYTSQNPMYVASKYQIKEGEARILCTIDEKPEWFNVNICKVDLHTKEENKGMVIEVTDSDLLEKTGGIVQGMSGSPIVQNQKIIGAITHVFVQNSAKGYGIFIENMLHNVE